MIYIFVIQVEEDPHNFFAFALIGDFLFGTTPEQVILIILSSLFECRFHVVFAYIVSDLLE